jgi:carboxypeptidase Q
MSKKILLHSQSSILYLLFSIFHLLFSPEVLFSQNSDSLAIRRIFNEALSDQTAYKNLEYLCTHISGRICGSPQAEEAVKWAKKVLDGMNLDTVFLQECKVRHWVRGNAEEAIINRGKKPEIRLNACAIGGSVETGEKGITANVIEVVDFEELKKLGREKTEGKIVFFNHPPNPAVYYTFEAYGEVAKYRVFGAAEAAKYGAVAVIVRSATLAHDNYPHTGILHYADTLPQLPAMAISTNDADKLSKDLKKNPSLSLFIRVPSTEYPETESHNVIGEIRGSEHPEEVIVFGGHLDAWDKGEGAHDDGAGVVQTIEVLRLFKTLGIKPKRTIRVVAFMDEEMDQRGGKAYAACAKQMLDKNSVGNNIQRPDSSIQNPVSTNFERPLAAIEADRGGTTPFGFSIDATDDQVAKIRKWKELLLPYGLYTFEKGGSGVDIRDLKPLGTALIALVTDSQRYFDYHHSANDSFDKINQRELQLGSFSIAALVYLIDYYGL